LKQKYAHAGAWIETPQPEDGRVIKGHKVTQTKKEKNYDI